MRRNNETPLGCYLIIIIIASPFFLISMCNDRLQDKEKKIKYDKLAEERKNYLNQFDFDFEEVTKDIENLNLQKIQRSKPNKPLIIFQKRVFDKKNELFFTYELNKKLEKGYMSFKKNEINTIVVISDTLINVGYYSRTNKIGFKNNILISYIDKKTNRVIKNFEIEGEEPPKEIRYHENDDYNKVYGKRPSELEIYENIVNNIN
ncbi:hypothetical protein [Flavobacterium xanthum]|uniref:Uncharacterized protein n=1 Tax=Flavobacterium xanthum TaxID=69322 RepID=A0A1M7L981_9FLAO|nr:hypothetical protein [Flavobacterium xanthum]SHM73920.1 hypothetical protein SAMN05443669_10642 [Flavobacterium xanthum]